MAEGSLLLAITPDAAGPLLPHSHKFIVHFPTESVYQQEDSPHLITGRRQTSSQRCRPTRLRLPSHEFATPVRLASELGSFILSALVLDQNLRERLEARSRGIGSPTQRDSGRPGRRFMNARSNSELTFAFSRRRAVSVVVRLIGGLGVDHKPGFKFQHSGATSTPCGCCSSPTPKTKNKNRKLKPRIHSHRINSSASAHRRHLCRPQSCPRSATGPDWPVPTLRRSPRRSSRP